MSAGTTIRPWADINHARLVREFARLKRQFGDSAEPNESVEAASDALHTEPDQPAAIDLLVELFRLTPFERDILLLCAGVEMDSELAVRCATAQVHLQRPLVTFGLAMATLGEPHWSALTPARPLRRFHLLDLSGNSGLAATPIRMDERILHYLAGMNLLEPSLESLLTFVDAPALMGEKHQATARSVANFLVEYAQYSPVVHLCGDDSQGQEDVAAVAAHQLGRQLFTVRTEDLPSSPSELEHLTTLLEREFLLLPAAFLMQCAPTGLTHSVSRLLEKLPVSVFLASQEPVRLRRGSVRFDVDKPSPAEQRELWQRALGDNAEHLNGTLDDLSQHFRLSARMIFSTGSLAAPLRGELNQDALWNACRSLARPKLEDLAQRIVPNAGWEDLVLPEAQKNILRQLAAQVRHRMKVHETWGFSAKGRRGLGVSALFCGDSGTGKTLAAEVLAYELGLDLYRIDLASVVSKYIGETEKNLKRIFDAAEEGGVLLLFDEADALFGKRGEVQDSHDRYANIEVGYLLQRMESYQGLAILTTNLRASLDRAFQRRLRFTVTFPFPDALQREAIWRKVFPSATPTHGLSVKRLSQLNVAGGNIRNIALNAAFAAANAGSAVKMNHLIEAAQLEAHKLERPLAEAEIRGWL